MVKEGLFAEVATLIKTYDANLPSLSGIGYSEVVAHLNENTSKEELFDIVDENDNPLGFTKTRKEAHREPLQDWHRTTHVWINNAQKEMLCQQRSLTKDSNPEKRNDIENGDYCNSIDEKVLAYIQSM